MSEITYEEYVEIYGTLGTTCDEQDYICNFYELVNRNNIYYTEKKFRSHVKEMLKNPNKFFREFHETLNCECENDDGNERDIDYEWVNNWKNNVDEDSNGADDEDDDDDDDDEPSQIANLLITYGINVSTKDITSDIFPNIYEFLEKYADVVEDPKREFMNAFPEITILNS